MADNAKKNDNKPAEKADKKVDKMKYEDAVKRLEEIVAKLENNTTPLDDSISLFDEGIKLAAYCTETLENAEQKVARLTKENADD